MNVLCVDQNRIKLRQLIKDARKLVPGVCIIPCRNPNKAVVAARTRGCDVLMTEVVFDGFSMNGVMLAKQIQNINPRVSIIFIADHEDTSAAYAAWEIGASAFLLRPYEKHQLAKAFTDLRFAPVKETTEEV